jgi:hypothetical protein
MTSCNWPKATLKKQSPPVDILLSFMLFRHFQRIIDLNPEVSNHTFQFDALQ